jgi:hypothetical protein
VSGQEAIMRARTLSIACGLLVCAGAGAFAQPVDPDEPAPIPEAPPPPPTPPPPPPPPEPARVTAEVEPAEASDGQMALLFNLNNIFTSGAVLGGWQGFGIGLQRDLGGNAALRIGLDAFRVHDPVRIVKTTRVNGPMEVVGYELQLPGSGFTQQHGLSLALDYLKLMSAHKLAPYAGGGVFAFVVDRRLSYTDDLTVTDQETDVSRSATSLGLGVRGIFGARWRVSQTFSLFAEYGVIVQAFSRNSSSDRTTLTSTVTGMPASETVVRESTSTSWFDLDVGLIQGGALGVIANF